MFGFLFSEKERDAMTQPKTDLAYLRNEKAKAEQKLRSCQHREKILERQMSELNRRERVHRLCTRAGMLESFLVCPGELTDDQMMVICSINFPPTVPTPQIKRLRTLYSERKKLSCNTLSDFLK